MKKTILLIIAAIGVLYCNGQSYNFSKGLEYYKNADYNSAYDYFSREITDNPGNALALYYRAYLNHYWAQNSLALTDINNAIIHYPAKDKDHLGNAYRFRAKLYKELLDTTKALSDQSKAIKLVETNPDYWFDRAQTYTELKDWPKAESDLQEIIESYEANARARTWLGRNYLYQKNYQEAIKYLSQSVTLDPNNAEGFYYRAKLNYEKEYYDEAIKDIFQCVALNQSSTTPFSEPDSDPDYLLMSFSKKNFPLAMEQTNTLINRSPELDYWYYVRARFKLERGEYKNGADDFTRVLSLTGSIVKNSALKFRGICFTNLGNQEKAIADFSGALYTDSLDEYSFIFRGDSRRLSGDFEGAVNDYTKAIELNPNLADIYYRRGWVKEDFLNEDLDGLNDYNESLLIDKNYVYTYLHRGIYYKNKLNDTLKANNDFRKILSIDTLIESGYSCRHFALFYLGRSQEALEWQLKILELNPTAYNYYDAARLYSLMNNPTETISNLKMAFIKGFRSFVHIMNNDDFNNIRDLKEFRDLVEDYTLLHEKYLAVENDLPPHVTEKTASVITIPMNSKGTGTYDLSCEINGLRLNMIFDTGAGVISISQTEVKFMLKNGYLSQADILGYDQYMVANGDIEVGTKINLRKVDLGGLVLRNVSASVVHNDSAPLLFGQSALSKYGKIEIDNEKKVITITN